MSNVSAIPTVTPYPTSVTSVPTSRSSSARVSGGIGAMVDLDLNPWDAAATQVLVPEAGGRCVTLAGPEGKLGLVFGSAALVEQLLRFLEPAPAR